MMVSFMDDVDTIGVMVATELLLLVDIVVISVTDDLARLGC